MRAFVLTIAGALTASGVAQDCQPELLSTTALWAGGGSIAVSGSIAALGSGNEGPIEFVDLSDPHNPVILSHYIARNSPDSMAISGEFLFVGQWCSFCGGRRPQLEVLDFSDPTAPVSVAEVPTGKQPRSIDIDGDFLYMCMWDFGGPDQEIRIYDISDPVSPTVAAQIPVPDLPRAVAVVDDLLYASVDRGMLLIFDVEDPTDPRLIGSVENTFARGIAVADGFAYLANSAGLQIIDVRDPTNPLLIGDVQLPASSKDVVVSGGVAYVALDEFGASRGVAAVDIRDPFDPIILGTTFFDDGRASELSMMGPDLLLVAAGIPGLRVLDISSCRPCPADLTGSSDPDDDTYGVPDGDADADDFFFYLDRFAAGDMTTCDIDDDGDCDAEDFFAYLDLFAGGC